MRCTFHSVIISVLQTLRRDGALKDIDVESILQTDETANDIPEDVSSAGLIYNEKRELELMHDLGMNN